LCSWVFLHSRDFALSVLRAPIRSRRATRAIVIIVSRRNFAANSTVPP
jgi:hypothetical protein